MNYNQTIEYLYNRLPVFQHHGEKAMRHGLSGIQKLCDYLGNPEQKLKCIHIAGTNGKGSSSHMIASVLQVSGYKTGLYTSPHLLDFRERIRINGICIPQEKVVSFVNTHRDFIENNDFSFFEVTVAMCFDHFVNEQVEIAVIEVGLGGRLDSTNVIQPIISLITNISWDHKNILGDTLPKIASEKAGIIKKNIPVVISQTQAEVAQVFINKAIECESSITFADQNWHITGVVNKTENKELNISNIHSSINCQIKLDLKGGYQMYNVLGVLELLWQLKISYKQITIDTIKQGLNNVIATTGLLGRWQTVGNEPLAICDTGHNEDGIKEVIHSINATEYDKLHIVIGFANDKEIENILSMLPQNAKYYFCKANVMRGLPADELKLRALKFGLIGNSYPNVDQAYNAAITEANTNDLIFIGGSTFIVADLLILLDKNKWDEKN